MDVGSGCRRVSYANLSLIFFERSSRNYFFLLRQRVRRCFFHSFTGFINRQRTIVLVARRVSTFSTAMITCGERNLFTCKCLRSTMRQSRSKLRNNFINNLFNLQSKRERSFSEDSPTAVSSFEFSQRSCRAISNLQIARSMTCTSARGKQNDDRPQKFMRRIVARHVIRRSARCAFFLSDVITGRTTTRRNEITASRRYGIPAIVSKPDAVSINRVCVWPEHSFRGPCIYRRRFLSVSRA